MSHDVDPTDPGAAKTMTMWRTISYIALIPITAWSIFELTSHEDEDEEYKPVPYRNIHLKPLPWGDGKTPLFATIGGWTPEKEKQEHEQHGHSHH